jgi:hypothetical protein
MVPAGLVDRDAAPGGGGSGQQWALRHNATGSGDNKNQMNIADWASNPVDANGAWTVELWTRAWVRPINSAGVLDLGAATGGAGTNFVARGSNGANISTLWNFSNLSTGFWIAADDYNGTNWIHLAVVFDPTIATFGHHWIIRNGVIAGQRDNEHLVALGRGKIVVLGAKGDVQRPQMDIFDLRIWSTVRTEAEIADNMGATLSPSEPGLEANFLLNDDAEGDSPVDATGSTTAALEQTGSALSWVAITDPR